MLPAVEKDGAGAERLVRRAVAGVAFDGPGPDGQRLVTVSALEQGAQRRAVLAVGPDQEAGLRRLLGADRPLSAAELAGQVPGLDAGRARELMDLLLRTGFLRAA